MIDVWRSVLEVGYRAGPVEARSNRQ